MSHPGCLTGMFIMVYYYPYINGWFNHLYTLKNQGFFHCSFEYQLIHFVNDARKHKTTRYNVLCFETSCQQNKMSRIVSGLWFQAIKENILS